MIVCNLLVSQEKCFAKYQTTLYRDHSQGVAAVTSPPPTHTYVPAVIRHLPQHTYISAEPPLFDVGHAVSCGRAIIAYSVVLPVYVYTVSVYHS